MPYSANSSAFAAAAVKLIFDLGHSMWAAQSMSVLSSITTELLRRWGMTQCINSRN